MRNKLTLDWLVAALIRAARTMAQTALGMLTVGAAVSDIKWGQLVSVALVAGLISLLTSIVTTLPEVGSDGVITINSPTTAVDATSEPYGIAFNTRAASLGEKKKVTLTVISPKK